MTVYEGTILSSGYHRIWSGSEAILPEQLSDSDSVFTGTHWISGKKYKEVLRKTLENIAKCEKRIEKSSQK